MLTIIYITDIAYLRLGWGATCLVIGFLVLTPVAFLKEVTFMNLCYMDESGTPDIPGNSSHFILVGFSIPITYWKISLSASSSYHEHFPCFSSLRAHSVAWHQLSFPLLPSIPCL